MLESSCWQLTPKAALQIEMIDMGVLPVPLIHVGKNHPR